MMNYCNLLTSFLSCIITAYVVKFHSTSTCLNPFAS